MMRLPRNYARLFFAAVLYTAAAIACGLPAGCNTPDDGRPAELESDCYGWPDREFGPFNTARPHLPFSRGDPAVDFTLKDTGGREWGLLSLLSSKPVLMVLGSFT